LGPVPERETKESGKGGTWKEMGREGEERDPTFTNRSSPMKGVAISMI